MEQFLASEAETATSTMENSPPRRFHFHSLHSEYAVQLFDRSSHHGGGGRADLSGSGQCFAAGSCPSFPPDFSSVGERSASVGFRWREARKPTSISRDERRAVCPLQTVQDSCRTFWGERKIKRISGGDRSSSALAQLSEKCIFYVAFGSCVSNAVQKSAVLTCGTMAT